MTKPRRRRVAAHPLSSDGAALTREQFEARAAALSFGQLEVFLAASSLATIGGLLLLSRKYAPAWLATRLSEGSRVALLVGGVALLVVALEVAWRRAARRAGLACPGCGALLVGGNPHQRTTVEVLSSGTCPRCRRRVLGRTG